MVSAHGRAIVVGLALAGLLACARAAPPKPAPPPKPPPAAGAQGKSAVIVDLEEKAKAENAEAAFELGRRYERGQDVAADPALSESWYLRAADLGHAQAQALLVERFLRKSVFGTDAPGDFAKVVRWVRDAGERGNPYLQQLLAKQYARGGEVGRDYTEAAKWFRKAAEKGAASAQFNLAVMYLHGLGVGANPQEAARWYRRAADQGDVRAQFSLGMLYAYGLGVPNDPVEAHRWIGIAVAQDAGFHAEAAFALLEEVAAKLTPAQIAAAQRAARDWKPRKE
jgi:hypothetical protein